MPGYCKEGQGSHNVDCAVYGIMITGARTLAVQNVSQRGKLDRKVTSVCLLKALSARL